VLDDLSGNFLALGIMRAFARLVADGGSWLLRISLL